MTLSRLSAIALILGCGIARGDAPPKIPLKSIITTNTDVFNIGKLQLHPISGISADVNSGRIVNLADPVGSQDAVTKAWALANGGSSLPSQITHSGQYLTTDGTTATWGAVNSLPSQASHAGQYLTTDGTVGSWGVITLDNVLPAFTITGFGSSGFVVKELGDTIVSPTFTVSYNRTASAATISDGGIFAPVTLTSPYTSATEAHTYACGSNPNSSITWTITANESGGPSKTASNNAVCRARAWWGMATPATITSSFVTTLPSTQLSIAVGGTYGFGAGGNTMKGYFCHDSSFAYVGMKDNATGFAIPTTPATAVSVTNAFGVARNVTCEVTNNFLNAAFTGLVN